MSHIIPTVARRVLVIEDDDLIRDLLDHVLGDAGYRVLATDHVLDIVDVQQLRPDVVLLDLHLHGRVAGWDYLRQLRSQSATAHLPVIIATCEFESVRTATASDLDHATGMILKPFDIEELTDTVAAALRPAAPRRPLTSPGVLEPNWKPRSRPVVTPAEAPTSVWPGTSPGSVTS